MRPRIDALRSLTWVAITIYKTDLGISSQAPPNDLDFSPHKFQAAQPKHQVVEIVAKHNWTRRQIDSSAFLHFPSYQISFQQSPHALLGNISEKLKAEN